MTLPSTVLVTRTILFTVWSAMLAVVGLTAFCGPVTGAWMRSHAFWLGLSALCAGQFVFMAAVADRWFPYADRRLVGLLEGGVFLGLILSGTRFVLSLW